MLSLLPPVDFATPEPETRAHAMTKKIIRFDRFIDPETGKGPLYPLSDHIHQLNVGAIARAITRRARDELELDVNPNLAQALGEMHDFDEIDPRLGDPQRAHADVMTAEQLADLARRKAEARPYAIKRLRKHFRGFLTTELFRLYEERTSFEAQAAKAADGLDMYGYCAHEIHAGNSKFLETQSYHGHTLLPPVINYSTKEFPSILEKLPLVRPLFENPSAPLFRLPEPRSLEEWHEICRNGKPHTQASIVEMIWSGKDPLYAAWLEIILKSRNKECIEWLLQSPVRA